MKNPKIKMALAMGVAAFAMVVQTHAGGITNYFDTGADFVANGILPSSALWDGVYLNGGDVTDGQPDEGAVTLQANEAFTGYLTVQNTIGGFAGSQDSGFFLYKMVSGDFDVSVQNAPTFDNQNYCFAGLMVRGADFQDGAPLGGGENWLQAVRFQEFGYGDGPRYAVDGVNDEPGYTAGSDSDTNSFRYFRITRVGDEFTLYHKTNSFDAWAQLGMVTRTNFNGLPVQVGIYQGAFTPNQPLNYFAEFELTGPNVATGTPPANPTGIASSVVNSNTVQLTWTPGAGSDGSLVLVRANGPITHKPADGLEYVGDSDFTSTNSILGGAGVRVAYVGAGNSVNVTGLGGNINDYSFAVYSLSGTGASTTYGVNPASVSIAGPGALVDVSFSVSPTTLPVGGVGVATVTATYAAGDSYDVSADPSTSWVSDNTSVIQVDSGILSAIATGSALITATFDGIPGSETVTVVTPAFTDDFSVTHDYLTSGVPGSKWDGAYLRTGDLPGGDGLPFTTVAATANGITNNALVIRANNTSWTGPDDHGVLLFKNVSGDFQASVHVQAMDRLANQFAGLMARAAEPDGSPLGGSENWLYFGQFDQYGFSVETRNTVDGANQEFALQDNDHSNWWLLMQRSGNLFTFFRKVNMEDPWAPLPGQTIVRDDLAGLPVQVGLFQAMYTANTGEVVFDSFMLNAAGLSTGTLPTPPSGLNFSSVAATTMDVNWTPGTGSTGSVVVVRAQAPVNANPINGVTYMGNTAFGAGSNLGSGNYVVYVGTGNSVTVTGLMPGNDYYVAVYSYGGEAGSPVYNTAVSGGVGSVTLGVAESISVILPSKLPVGGLGRASVLVNYSGGYSAPVSSGLSFSSGDTNVVATYNSTSVLSGFSEGTTTITAVYTGSSGSFTNSALVTVGAPTVVDNFDVSHNYKTAGVTGTIWDGVYATGQAPSGSLYVPDGSASVSVADANISSNSTLTVTTLNVGWEHAQDNGFLLYKDVSTDFQVAVHVQNTLIDAQTNAIAPYNNPGLMARAVMNGNLPFVGGTNESYISWTRFDEFGIGTYARRILNNVTTPNGQPQPGDGDYWLLMVRKNGTNFSFYQRSSNTEPWQPAPNGTTYNVAAFQGATMQVGLLAAAYNSGNSATAQFDSFMLDIVVPQPELEARPDGSNVIVSWPEGPGTLQSTLSLTAPDWQNVTATTSTNSGIISVSIPATNDASFFRLAE